MEFQILINGIILGALYACIAVGFSLVWGVLNVINMLHGSFIILGGYIAFFAWAYLGIHPVLMIPVCGVILYGLGYLVQLGIINKVVSQPVLVTLTLTFGLDMILYNFMNVAFTATPRRITLDLGSFEFADIFVPYDRLLAMALAFALTAILWWVMRKSRIGRAIVAVRMDSNTAALMGIRVEQIYAITFGIGALMAGSTGAVFAFIFPITSHLAGLYIGKAFVVCVIGGLGNVPGALIGGIALGIIESFAGHWFGPQHAITVGFVLMMLLLVTSPTGLFGKKGYE
jgi:branched-chain amino acid transport system permease protein